MRQFGEAVRSEWMFEPGLVYLNHGTVGAPPRRVLDAQQAIRDEIEANPARFQLRELADSHGTGDPAVPRLRAAAREVGAFLGVPGDDLLFVDNTTTGANAVFRSFPFRDGDEVLVTDLAYGAVVNAATYATGRHGATVRAITAPPVGAPPEQFVDAIVGAVGPRTRIVLVDHVTAHTALRLPVEEIVRGCQARGAAVLVDGAHVPGAFALDIPAIGADWYTGNLHKWGWTPRSSGVLWAAPQWRGHLHPTVISWGYGVGLTNEFDLLGTRDPSAFLAAPAAFRMMEEWGVEHIRGWNHDLVWQAAQLLADRWGTPFTTPESMIGTMAHVDLPPAAGSTPADAELLRVALTDEEHIEVPVFHEGDHLAVRICAQVYNHLAEYEHLAQAVLTRC